MGLFGSMRQLTEQGRENVRSYDAADRLAQASASMAAVSQTMAHQVAAATFAAEGRPARASVVAVRDTGARVNLDPIVEFDLLVTFEGELPYATTVSQTVALALLEGAVAGAELAVRVAPQDRSTVWIDWHASSR